MKHLRVAVEMNAETGAITVSHALPDEVALGILMAAWRNVLTKTIIAEVAEREKKRPRIVQPGVVDITR